MKQRLAAPRLIDWTGERCVPWADDPQVIYEHLHRYLFAAELTSDKEVIDLGSGEGYGTALMASRAKRVLGVEIDPDSVEHARLHYPLENVHFRCGSVLDLDDLDADSFDVVVCFEMIEHIAEQDELVATAGRLLRPGGLFLVSTPDREVYSDAHDYHNPYHVRELNRSEFRDLLGAHFAHARIWDQTALVRSSLEDTEGTGGVDGLQEFAVWRVGDHWERTEVERAPYLIALASDAALPPLPARSILSRREPPHDEYGELQQGYELWGTERLRRQVAIFEAALTAEVNTRQQLAGQVEQLTAALDEAQAAVHELAEIKGSRSWHVLTEYRRLRTLARRVR